MSGRTASNPIDATTSAAANDTRPLVNWDIVHRDVRTLHIGLIEFGNRVQDGWRRLTG
jgi:hypothetical protein